MTDLRPCPFCGGEAKLHTYKSGKDFYYVGCENEDCPVMPDTRNMDTKEKAIAVWNTRYTDDDGK